uniref:Uncharacterized protein n=1 Tax=Ornithorhynchus anatinus TaxID=9258 RepID=A0A6I8PKQ9_ORNAN
MGFRGAGGIYSQGIRGGRRRNFHSSLSSTAQMLKTPLRFPDQLSPLLRSASAAGFDLPREAPVPVKPAETSWPAAMASDLLKAMEDEVKCPVCMSYLKDPIFIDCGHIFCRRCVKVICQSRGLRGPPICPVCNLRFHQETIKPAWQAANMVKNIEDLRLKLEKRAGEEQRCLAHGEKLHFLCEDDGQLLCMVCRESREHRLHKMSVIKETVFTCKSEIQLHVQALQKEKIQVQNFQASGEGKVQGLLAWVEVEKRKVVSEFEQVRQFLKGREHLLLGKLEELEQDAQRGRAEMVAAVSAEIAQLEVLIGELEEKSQQEETEMLQVSASEQALGPEAHPGATSERAVTEHSAVGQGGRSLERPRAAWA